MPKTPVYSSSMRYLLVLLATWVGMALAAEPQSNTGATPSNPAKRVALVIGNAAYPGAGILKNPGNDAMDIAAKLTKLGFDVMVRTDVSLKEMLRALTEFGNKVQNGTEALFFYAGHGMQVRGRNYLIPIDADIRNEASVSSEAVDVDQLLDKLSSARLSMVILDACRNNPFERRFRGGGQGLAQINAPTGTLIAYATAPGKVAADGDGGNGLYTSELLSAMDVPGIKIEDVFKRVRANVLKKSGNAQTPWESSSLTGDFYFIPGRIRLSTEARPATEAQATIDPRIVELSFWESIKNSPDSGDFQAYLDKYPKGIFAAIAERRVSIRSVPSNQIDGNWFGELETYGGLFNVPVKAQARIKVQGGILSGEVFMYGETRVFSGRVDPSGMLIDAKLSGTNSYTLTGNLKAISGDGSMGWKLKMSLQKEK